MMARSRVPVLMRTTSACRYCLCSLMRSRSRFGGILVLLIDIVASAYKKPPVSLQKRQLRRSWDRKGHLSALWHSGFTVRCSVIVMRRDNTWATVPGIDEVKLRDSMMSAQRPQVRAVRIGSSRAGIVIYTTGRIDVNLPYRVLLCHRCTMVAKKFGYSFQGCADVRRPPGSRPFRTIDES